MRNAVEAFKRGKYALTSAEKLAGIDLPASASRAYIAGENLAVSLLLTIAGSAPRDHGKIWNSIKSLYEKGVLKENYRSVLETSYRIRIKADYGEDVGGIAVAVSRESIEKQIQNLNRFRDEVEGILKEKGFI